MPILELNGITKSYAGVQALKGVSFALEGGEVHALIGENGAGKSTLIKVVTGAVAPDSGTLSVDGQAVVHNSPAVARRLGIAAVYQQPALFPDLTVAENLALSLENGSIWRRIHWRKRDALARELLERAGAQIQPNREVRSLSMSEQQIVEIAKAIGARAKILILDEPTASLTSREVERLFGVLTKLRSEGVGIVYISHRLQEVEAVADRITVLRDGSVVETRPAQGVSRGDLIRMMVGRDVQAIFPKREVAGGDVLFEVRNLGCRAAGIHGISFTIRAGEILGFAGLVGSGRTQLAETLFGLTPADAGEVLLAGAPVRIGAPADAIRSRIAYLPEDRRRHGIILELPIAENATLATLGSVCRRGLIDSAQERAVAREYVGLLGIKTPSLYAEAGALSGGNQQKVALARWLAAKPQVLILDEPTQGVDVGSKSEIHQLMVDLAARGLAIIMISSELPEILGMSDRVAVMHRGTIAGILSRGEATQESVMALALGQRREGAGLN